VEQEDKNETAGVRYSLMLSMRIRGLFISRRTRRADEPCQFAFVRLLPPLIDLVFLSWLW
jgi:hypothetical protein